LTIQFITENSINLDQESEKKDLHCLKNMVWREYYDINPLHQNNTESNHGVPIMNIGIDKSRIEIFNLGWCCVTQFNNVEYRREMVTANQIVKLMATMGSFLVKWPKNKNNFENIWEFFFFPFFFFFVFCFLFVFCFDENFNNFYYFQTIELYHSFISSVSPVYHLDDNPSHSAVINMNSLTDMPENNSVLSFCSENCVKKTQHKKLIFAITILEMAT
jgi:hypothetical protein